MSRRRILIPVAAVVVLLLAAVVAARLLIDPERLKETALAQAREATGYDLTAGPASMRLSWSGAGIRVESFRMAAPDSSQTLTVERTDLYVKLLPLLRRQVELRELVLHRPRLDLAEPGPDARRRSPATGAGSGGPEAASADAEASPALAIFAVESWKVEDGALRRRGGGNELDLDGLDLEGGFRWTPAEGGRGTASGRATSGRFTGAAGALDLPPLEARARFTMNAAADSVSLPELAVESGAVRVTLSGGYALRGETWTGALAGRADPVDWSEIRPLLPAPAEAALEDNELDGRFTLQRLNLALTASGETEVSGEVLVERASARMAGAPLGLSEGTARVRFEPGLVVLEEGRGRLGGEAITFGGRVEGEPLRRYRATVVTSMSGPVLAGLMPPAARLALDSGAVEMDLAVAGTLPPDPANLPRLDGRLRLRDLAGTLRELPLRELRGAILFREGGASVNDLGARWGASDLLLNGVVPDLADPKLRFTLTGGLVDLDEAMPPETAATGAGAGAGEAAVEKDDAPLVGVPAAGWVEIQRLRVRGQELRDLRVHVDLGLEGLFLTEATGRVQGGNLTGRLDVVPGPGTGAWRYDGEATLTGVAAGPVVAQWLPAGERVEGRADADLTLSGVAGPDEDVRKGLTVEGDVSLSDGAFVNLSALRSVAQALQVKEGMGERWPFRDLWMRFAVRQGRVVVDTLRITQRGLGWKLAGSVGLAGDLDLTGTLRADLQVVSLPAEVAFFASLLAEEDGRVPIGFTIGGRFEEPSVGLDLSGLAARAAARAREQEGDALRKQLEDAATDPETLDRLKKLLGGKKKKPSGG